MAVILSARRFFLFSCAAVSTVYAEQSVVWRFLFIVCDTVVERISMESAGVSLHYAAPSAGPIVPACAKLDIYLNLNRYGPVARRSSFWEELCALPLSDLPISTWNLQCHLS